MQVFAFDIETSGIDFFSSSIVLTSVVSDTGEEWVFYGNEYPDWFKQALSDELTLKLVHNAAFDLKYIEREFGIIASNVWDTLAVERLLTSGIKIKDEVHPEKERGLPCDLANVAKRRLGKYLDKSIRDNFLVGRIGDREKEYCLDDSRVLHSIYKQQLAEVEANNQLTAATIEANLGIIVADMELTGIGFDNVLWVSMMEYANTMKVNSEVALYDIFEIPYSLDMFFGVSGACLSFTQRDKVMSLLQGRGIALKSYRTNDILAYIMENPESEHVPTLQAILEFKKWEKVTSWDYDSNVSSKTKRIHPSFNPQGADTFRFTSSNPNMQQVAQPLSDRVNFRHLFCAAPGNVIVGADYSQIELRLLADVTNDKNYLKAFTDGLDMHTGAAESVLKRPLKDKSERLLGKAINFGIAAYGGGPAALIRSALDYGILLTQQEAETYVSAIKRRNAVIERWGKSQHQRMLRDGYIQTAIGHRRWLKGEDRETVARNTEIQTLAAGILKDSMLPIFRRLQPLNAHLILQVHDELVVECSEGKGEEVQAILKEEMKKSGEKWVRQVPIEVDSYISRSWEK